ncbi:MAG: hypothetical protein HKP48_11550 [Winogradskyella sp.]|uniref:DUF5683 domain-containing protein n=1 Tax=Winogradskyella sp. TaxID=1883156 RepID=UPI00182839D3|nr:DUF5683 domain-containing protein [Winogradskyella sp.]MBT8245507.1 hypothetical protein [Winogradskyella sp.]NNK23892.1 hypothetical protein [Winogradskyella sp.]
MLNKPFILLFVCLSFSVFSFAQIKRDSTISTSVEDLKLDQTLLSKREIDPLRPSKAAFYSAILPGLGQAYNKKYWKVPIVLGAITTGVLVYDFNNNQYNRYRDAFKRRLAGFTDDEFFGSGTTPLISNDGLIRAQRQFRRNRDIATLVTVGIYVLNIIDANVDAHLLQFNVDENLAMRPHFQYNPMEDSSDIGVTVNFKF